MGRYIDKRRIYELTILKNRPLYKKIAAELLRRMRAGVYTQKTLPSEEQLAAEFSASKHTIRAVF